MSPSLPIGGGITSIFPGKLDSDSGMLQYTSLMVSDVFFENIASYGTPRLIAVLNIM